MEFIESRAFTRRLHQLVNESADELLRAIQGDLLILLDKNEQEDASDEQRKQIREWVSQIKKSSGG